MLAFRATIQRLRYSICDGSAYCKRALVSHRKTAENNTDPHRICIAYPIPLVRAGGPRSHLSAQVKNGDGEANLVGTVRIVGVQQRWKCGGEGHDVAGSESVRASKVTRAATTCGHWQCIDPLFHLAP